MFLAHGPLSAILNEKIRRKYFPNLGEKILPFTVLLSLIVGILPDFDFFIQAARSEPSFLHHHLITHTPIFWIVASAGVYLVLKLVEKGSKEEIKSFLKAGGTNLITIYFLVGTLSHIFSDMLAGHIMLFYPLSNIGFSLAADILPTNPTVTYLIHPEMVIETLIILTFVIYIGELVFKEILKNRKALFTITLSLFILTFGASLWVYKNTYLVTLPKDEQNFPNYDRDADSIDDYKDPDFNNNGVDNIDDNDRNAIKAIATDIMKSKSLSTYNNGKLEQFGWISSYGIISNAYYQAGYTIEPVIKKELGADNLRYNLKSLYEVLKRRDRIGEISIDGLSTNPGRVFFILQNDKVVNGGYTLDSGELAIILPEQKRVKTITIEDVRDYYKEGIKIEVEK